MKDLIISAIANYSKEKIKIYIESLKLTGFNGDKIMICYNVPDDTISYLYENDWECYSAELSGHPHMKRLIDIWWLMTNDSRKWRYVITTDVRDIEWQLNPSTWLSSNLKKNILVASESIKNKDEPWAYKNMQEGYGNIFWDHIKENTTANVGVIAGEYNYIKDLLQLVWLVSQAGDTTHFTDQSALNLLINNNLVSDKLQLDSNFALQVGTLNSDYRFENKSFKLFNNLVVNDETNESYVLIHQYDRSEELKTIIEKKYR